MCSKATPCSLKKCVHGLRQRAPESGARKHAWVAFSNLSRQYVFLIIIWQLTAVIQSLSFGKNNNNFTSWCQKPDGQAKREASSYVYQTSSEGEVHRLLHHPAAGTTSGQENKACGPDTCSPSPSSMLVHLALITVLVYNPSYKKCSLFLLWLVLNKFFQKMKCLVSNVMLGNYFKVSHDHEFCIWFQEIALALRSPCCLLPPANHLPFPCWVMAPQGQWTANHISKNMCL